MSLMSVKSFKYVEKSVLNALNSFPMYVYMSYHNIINHILLVKNALISNQPPKKFPPAARCGALPHIPPGAFGLSQETPPLKFPVSAPVDKLLHVYCNLLKI